MAVQPRTWAPPALVKWWRAAYSETAMQGRLKASNPSGASHDVAHCGKVYRLTFTPQVPTSERWAADVLLRLISDERMRNAWQTMRTAKPRDGWELRIAQAVIHAALRSTTHESAAKCAQRLCRVADRLEIAAREIWGTETDAPLEEYLRDAVPRDPQRWNPRRPRLHSALQLAAQRARIEAERVRSERQTVERKRKPRARAVAAALLPHFALEFGRRLDDTIATLASVATGEDFTRGAVRKISL